MQTVAVDASGTTLLHTHDEVRRRLADGSFVWVDLDCREGGAGDFGEHELADRLGLDLPRLGWLGRFDQPARVEVRDELAEIIVPFANGDSVVNVHVVARVKPQFLLTAHREAVPALDALRSSAGPRMGLQGHVALYLLLDAAMASFKRALAAVGQDLEDLQERVAPVPARQQLLGLATLRQRLARLHRAIGPYADAVDAFVAELPSRDDVPEKGQRLVHALAAHVASLSRDLVAHQEATAHEMETHAALVALRQSQVINRLTIVSTVLLPVTFVTSFFGMNFPYLIELIDGPLAFWVVGVGLQIVVVGAILLEIRRRGWLRSFRDTDR